jgi:enamine deaminase RidA (YjgF/YER057c/UK114 family)
MFCTAERLLDQCGMRFCDVVRTWIHLRDINRDYDALNTARREFFRHRGIERRPASTGVQGIPFPDAHDFSMTLHAVQSPQPLDVSLMSTPSLNEAWSYGVDFSRGLRLAEANKVALYISGTASIDEAGQTVHVGNFAAQVDRTLHNIASLLAQQGATFENVFSGVMYLKNPSDAPVLQAMCRERGFDGFPCALVDAPLCRPELLCEAEAVALLPLPTLGA